jgi:DNA-binding transcriptional ArsR family regulator
MTPLVATDTDELRSMITFRTSTIYEMWLSLRALQNPGHRHQDWSKQVKDRLSQEILEDLEFIHSRFEHGVLLMELAVDYPDHQDVEGFIHYVEQMNTARFLFYAVGRLAPIEKMAKLEPTMESLLSIAAYAFPGGSKYAERLRTAKYLELLADPETYKARMLRLWRRYWEAYFKEESKRYHQVWQESIKEKSLALSRQDALEFVKRLAGKPELPDQIPEGYTTQEIILVPSYFGPHHLMFFGYGVITLIYDCQITEQRREELEKLEEEIIASAKALDDKTRLELLKWIVRDPHIYGRKLAEICHISQPSVSRHLRILKEAGIIEERPIDNRIAYEVNHEKIQNFSQKLMTYLYE